MAMSRSRYFINILLRGGLLGLLLLVGLQAEAQTISMWQQQRLHAEREGWSRVMPTHVKVQYAGGMGLASVGVGWDYGRYNQLETDLQVGYLPRRYSDRNHAVFTLKQNWMPWNIRFVDWLGVEPLSCGVYLTAITGPRAVYWRSEPSKYGGTYYKFLTRFRAYFYVGQRATWYNRRLDSMLRSVSLYYELSTKELDWVAKFGNHDLLLTDMVYFSFGMKIGLGK